MTKETSTAKVLDELSRSNLASPRSSAQRQRQTATRGVSLLYFLFLPLLLLVLFLGYQQWILQREVMQFFEANNLLQERLNQSDSRIQQLTNELATPGQASSLDEALIEQIRRDFVTETDRLNSLLASLQNQRANGQVDSDDAWRLAEAEYLIEIANQQLHIGARIPVAIVLLESADSVLARSIDSRVSPVRQALGRELVQLRAVELSDSQSVYESLSGLRERVGQGVVTESVQDSYNERLVPATPPQTSTASNSPVWEAGLNFLSSIFIWREWDEVPDIQFPIQQGIQVNQNINLMLEQAQLAFMAGDAELYRSALNQARNWTAQYATDSIDNATGVIADLDALLSVEIEPTLPDISQSLLLMQQLRSGSNVNNNNL